VVGFGRATADAVDQTWSGYRTPLPLRGATTPHRAEQVGIQTPYKQLPFQIGRFLHIVVPLASGPRWAGLFQSRHQRYNTLIYHYLRLRCIKRVGFEGFACLRPGSLVRQAAREEIAWVAGSETTVIAPDGGSRCTRVVWREISRRARRQSRDGQTSGLATASDGGRFHRPRQPLRP